MPLFAYALAVYIAGLLAGFADSLLFVGVVIGTATAIGLGEARWTTPSLRSFR